MLKFIYENAVVIAISLSFSTFGFVLGTRVFDLDSYVRWSHFLGQPAKVGSSMRMTHHEDAETVFG
jgi:hypothetical protein